MMVIKVSICTSGSCIIYLPLNYFLGSVDPSDKDITVANRNGFICLTCSTPGLTGCVGVIHSALLDTFNLTVLTALVGVQECTNDIFDGEYSVAVFGVSDEELGDSPLYQTTMDMTPLSPTDLVPVSNTRIIVGVVGKERLSLTYILHV